MNFDQQNREAFRRFVAGWEERLRKIEARLDGHDGSLLEIGKAMVGALPIEKRGPGRPRKNPEQP